jgi:hypothetical protein
MKNLPNFDEFTMSEAKVVKEMALADVNVQRLLGAFDTATPQQKRRMTEVISGHAHTDRKRLERDFKELGYNELVDIMKELDMLPKK